MSQNDKPRALWTVPETADYYRVNERTIRNWIDKGALDVVRKGRTVRIVSPTSTSTTTNAA